MVMELDRLRLTLSGLLGDVAKVEVLFDGTPAEMAGIVVPGERAIEAWMRLRSATELLGRWPLLLGSRNSVELRAARLRGRRQTPAEVIAAAADVDARPRVWFQKVVDAERQWHVDNGYSADDALKPPEEGPWPTDPDEDSSFSIPLDTATSQPHAEVVIALLPTEIPWTIPAWLDLGGWNDCPASDKHCAVWKVRGETYGAEPVGASEDVVEFLVHRPPETREAAMELAWEQHGYCQDIVTQGTETISRLAGTLLEGRTWFFWWD